MKDLRKRSIVQTMFFATLLMSLVAVAAAQDDGICSNAGVAGAWGYTETGWAMQPTGLVPAASQGRYVLDLVGNLSGTRFGTAGGITTLKGTATVNSDCTGTLTVRISDQSGNLLFTVIKALVYVDNAREVRAIVRSVTLPNGTIIPTVLTANGEKLFPGNEQ